MEDGMLNYLRRAAVKKHYLQIVKYIFGLGTWPARKQVGILTAISLAIAAVLGFRFANGQETLDAYRFSRAAQQGKLIAPVPLNLTDKNPEFVYVGSYLVNAQLGCNSCHTCPSYKGTDPFKVGGPGIGLPGTPGPINTTNYLAGGVPFPGRGQPFQGLTLAAANLTPDSSGQPGGLSYADFKSAMQNGTVSGKPGHLLQVMPWPVFRNLYEADFVAIYNYLSAVPPAQPGVCALPGEAGK